MDEEVEKSTSQSLGVMGGMGIGMDIFQQFGMDMVFLADGMEIIEPMEGVGSDQGGDMEDETMESIEERFEF